MEGRITILLVLLACVPATLGFAVFVPYPPTYESSIEPAEFPSEGNSPGLLLLHGPVEPSESEAEASESEPAESVESESAEPVESDAAVAGGTNEGQPVQVNPDSKGFAGAGQPVAVPGMRIPGQAGGQASQERGNAFGGNPQQISSGKGSRAIGIGVAVGACFLVVVAVGVAAYVIRQQRRNRNMERLE